MKKFIILLVLMCVVLYSSCTLILKHQSFNKNPLLEIFKTPFEVPPFEKIRPDHYKPALLYSIDLEKKEIEAIIKNTEDPSYENTIVTLDKSGSLLRKVSAIFYNQLKSNSNQALHQIHLELSSIISEHRDEINLNTKLFSRIKSVYDKKEECDLTPEELFLLENKYHEFVRNGVNLSDDQKMVLKTLNKKLLLLATQFEQNLMTESDRYKLVIEKEEDLVGLPELVREAGSNNAKELGLDGKWVYTTRPASMYPFLTYSQKRNLRERLYMLHINRANNNDERDNKAIVTEIIKLRAEQAMLLGYKTYAHLALEQNMAKKPEIVKDLLHEIWSFALPFSKLEAKQIQDVIDEGGENFKLASWDWWYYTEKIQMARFHLNLNEIRPYFKLENVRDGAFWVANKLYGIRINRLNKIPLPHPEAQAFEINELNGDHIGILYMDFHHRIGKKEGAWCVKYREHHVEDGREIFPVVAIECNFSKPNKGAPCLLSMEEVTTLFHEFGHALDALFSKKTYNSSYYARDFIELPSQIMEHWVRQPEVLKHYATHYESGEIIPDELIEKINAASALNQGFNTVKYIAASLLDLIYHSLEAPVDIDVDTFEDEYFRSIGLIPEIISKYRSTYFSHIIGSYAASYYSYAWSMVLDMDAFEAFTEKGIFDQVTAYSFRENILERNGIESAMKMFINFRGHEPSIGSSH